MIVTTDCETFMGQISVLYSYKAVELLVFLTKINIKGTLLGSTL